MKLAIDAMSGDLGSSIVVEACRSFLEKNKTDELYVVGKIEELEALKEYQQVTLIDARETFEMTENILAIRRKKESSLVKAMMLARNNEVDGVLSCGNTGAYYACAMLFLKRIKGIDKSCLMATMQKIPRNSWYNLQSWEMSTLKMLDIFKSQKLRY